MAKTRNIRIVQPHDRNSHKEHELQHNEMMVDYKDFVFYQRLVEGMQRRQCSTKDIALRYENQALIDRIVRTRHAQPQQQGSEARKLLPHPSEMRSSSRVPRVRSRADLIECVTDVVRMTSSEDDMSDYEEDMIFDFEI